MQTCLCCTLSTKALLVGCCFPIIPLTITPTPEFPKALQCSSLLLRPRHLCGDDQMCANSKPCWNEMGFRAIPHRALMWERDPLVSWGHSPELPELEERLGTAPSHGVQVGCVQPEVGLDNPRYCLPARGVVWPWAGCADGWASAHFCCQAPPCCPSHLLLSFPLQHAAEGQGTLPHLRLSICPRRLRWRTRGRVYLTDSVARLRASRTAKRATSAPRCWLRPQALRAVFSDCFWTLKSTFRGRPEPR